MVLLRMIQSTCQRRNHLMNFLKPHRNRRGTISFAENECLDVALVGARIYSLHLRGQKTFRLYEDVLYYCTNHHSEYQEIDLVMPDTFNFTHLSKQVTCRNWHFNAPERTGPYINAAGASFADGWWMLRRAGGTENRQPHAILIQSKKSSNPGPISCTPEQSKKKKEHKKCSIDESHTTIVFVADHTLSPPLAEHRSSSSLRQNECILDGQNKRRWFMDCHHSEEGSIKTAEAIMFELQMEMKERQKQEEEEEAFQQQLMRQWSQGPSRSGVKRKRGQFQGVIQNGNDDDDENEEDKDDEKEKGQRE